MRRFLLTVLFSQLLLCTVSHAKNKLSDFDGKWLRDEIISQKGAHLPRKTWHITVQEKTLTLVELSEEGKASRTVIYNLDGTETFSEMRNRPDRKITHALKFQESSGVVELTEIMPGSNDPIAHSMSMIITETWQLTNNGDTLQVVRKFRPGDGAIPIRFGDQTYSFQKVKEGSVH
jgi:hypothetical protein